MVDFFEYIIMFGIFLVNFSCFLQCIKTISLDIVKFCSCPRVTYIVCIDTI